MEYYQEVTLLPDAEIPVHFLWTKVFTQLHIAFADRKNKIGCMDFAVSFPEYAEVGPGSKLRIFADTEEILQSLELKLILQRFLDYAHVTRVRAVPKNRIKSYAVYSRYQGDGSVHQKAMRYARRHPETTYEQAVKFLRQKKDKERFPYIQMKSISNQNQFRLFVQKKLVDSPCEGEFGTYGLSARATVPEF
ncbi:type I-F CRISPR-associated endoribonuclease Cas6/Csy4 [Colibacter massiliensis]|uniref:type I-F CRISPR-associated endoribonuclease Cas6/Csy4 n=1 Tax=Colibacter massiliensis TaxID=1852379 RepID=UPI00266C2B5A|nr:type I-F CRISPR-associated endoribonuclease Cas6/Csy4 [Colibacter massiliensis]